MLVRLQCEPWALKLSRTTALIVQFRFGNIDQNLSGISDNSLSFHPGVCREILLYEIVCGQFPSLVNKGSCNIHRGQALDDLNPDNSSATLYKTLGESPESPEWL